jgi:hypothetical protein
MITMLTKYSFLTGANFTKLLTPVKWRKNVLKIDPKISFSKEDQIN